MTVSVRIIQRQAAVAEAASFLLILLAVGSIWIEGSGRRVRLPGNAPPSLRQAAFLQRHDPGSLMTVVVALKGMRRQELADLIARQNDSSSPDFHRYVSPEEFNERFAPPSSRVDGAVKFLKSRGLFVLQVMPNNMFIETRGTTGQVERAFDIRINDYRLRGKVRFSNDRAPSVPPGAGD